MGIFTTASERKRLRAEMERSVLEDAPFEPDPEPEPEDEPEGEPEDEPFDPADNLDTLL